MPSETIATSQDKEAAPLPDSHNKAGRMPSKRIMAVSILALVVIAVLVAIYMTSNASARTVAVGDTIAVNYTGMFTNGTVFDSSAGRSPLQFTVGSGQLIKGFDQGVVGMKLGEEKTITIPANEAYGEWNSSLVIHVPLSVFGNQTVAVGNTVSQGTASGQLVHGVVTAVNATSATLDFNSPLAGKTLVFEIKIVAIQKKS